jgi:hypothetical protein
MCSPASALQMACLYVSIWRRPTAQTIVLPKAMRQCTSHCPALPCFVCAGQSVAELQARAAPVTPELAVLITPFMVALSGAAHTLPSNYGCPAQHTYALDVDLPVVATRLQCPCQV